MALFPIIRDTETKDFLDATERGEFLLAYNKATGEYSEPRTDVISNTDLEYVPAAGTGTVVSWTVAHTKADNGNPTKTGLGIVQLTEGPWWWGRIEGVTDHEQPTGKSVHVTFEKTGPDEDHATIPIFVLD